MEHYVVAIQGLRSLRFTEDLPKEIVEAARMTVNAATRRALATSGKEIRRQVNFPAHYLTGQNGRLKIVRLASGNDLTGEIAGRRRPTSLARFVTSSLSVGGGQRAPGVTVQVRPGSAVRLKRAFLMKLRAGSDADTQHNLGLAVRLKAGQRPTKAYKPKQIGKGLWLLYGPSVDSVFVSATSGQGVAEQISPEIAEFMEREFLRLVELRK